MSILIKGMEMPKDRAVSVRILPNGEAVIYVDEPYETDVIEVLDHGRLIDADKLMEKGVRMYWSVQKWVQEVDIMLAPTIVPAEGGGEDG